MGHDFPTRNPLSSQATAGLSEVGMKYFPTWPTKSLAGFAQKKKKKESLDSGYYSLVIKPAPAETGKRPGERRSEGRTPLRKKKIPPLSGLVKGGSDRTLKCSAC